MRMSSQILTAAFAAATVLAGASAQAATLTGAITADNEFNAYLSTSDSTLGTLIASGANWPNSYGFSDALTAGQTYYLHVVANNFGGPGNMAGGDPDALLGSFSLSGTGFSFANGGQTFATGVAGWRVSPSSTLQNLGSVSAWTAPTGTAADFGANGGDNIWARALGGPVSGISTSAHWIWSQTDPSGEAFFSTTISAAGVPEPAAWALMIVGFGLTGAALRRRRQMQTPALARI